MKRIIFLVKKKPNFIKRLLFSLRMIVRGVRISFRDCNDIDKDTLIAVDTKEQYDSFIKKGITPLIVVDDEEQIDSFTDAKYFVMDYLYAEYEYYDRIFRRINNIPWEMIKTKRLILRETVEEDVDTFYEMYRDPRMTLYMEDLYADPAEEKKYVVEYRERVYSVQGFGIWTVIRKSDRAIVGRAGLTVRAGFEDIEIGFAIGSEYWGMGYAKEAIAAIIDFAAELGFEHLIALVMPGNEISKHILNNYGFECVSKTFLSGKEYDVFRR